MAAPRTLVPAPPVTPLPFGLFSAAVVTDDLNDHAQMGTHYETSACAEAALTAAACQDTAVDFDPGPTGLPLVEDHPFTVYSLLQCNVVGLSEARLEDRAREALRLGEQRAVEQMTAALLPLATDAVTLAGGAAVHPVEGLALLEGYAARHYGGVPTIHVPRVMGALLASGHVIERAGNHLETAQGAYVASGGGYYDLAGPAPIPADPDDPRVPVEPGADQAWLYVTGTTVVRRASSPEVIPLTMSRRPARNLGTAMAERAYSVAWECITAAVLVDVVRA